MSLSQSVQQRLDTAKVMQLAYRPNAEVAGQIKQKDIVMFVGPAGCGKSYLMQQIDDLNADSTRVVDITSRPPRADDTPGSMIYIAHDDANINDMLGRIERGELVQWSVHPTTGYFYATTIDGYKSENNLLEVLSSMVTYMRTLPFHRATVIGVATDPSQWEAWFNSRFPIGSDERHKRLQEAIMSLEWLTDATHGSLVQWVINTPGGSGAEDALAIIRQTSYGGEGRTTALSMLEWARSQFVSS